MVFDFLKNNNDCNLPCLWNLTPGKTDKSTLDNFTARFGKLVTPDVYVDISNFEKVKVLFLDYRENNIIINVRFSASMNKDKSGIEMLVLDGYAMQERGKKLNWLSPDVSPVYGDASFNQAFTYYLLPQILSKYGRPSQVLLRPFTEDPQRPDIQWYPFSLVLLYPEQGIFIEYVSPRETIGSNYVGCPSKVSIRLAAWNPEPTLSLKYVVQAGSQINELNMDYFKPIEKATSMTLDEFYQTFKSPENTSCVETPQKLWQP